MNSRKFSNGKDFSFRHALWLRPVLGSVCAVGLVFPVLPDLSAAESTKPIKVRAVRASSSNDKYPAALAIDGKINDVSRWVSEKSAEAAWLEVEFERATKLGGVHIYSGYGQEAAINDFSIEFLSQGKWVEIPSASVANNQAVAIAVPFDQTLEVETTKLRLVIKTSHQQAARIKELVVWPYGPLPQLKATGGKPTQPGAQEQSEIPLIYLNQSGFNLGKPKKFTAPTLADGTPFVVRLATGTSPLFEGRIEGKKGDFSAFNPDDPAAEYVVEAGGLRSVPFRIAAWWFERINYQGMVDFMIDSRHYVGNDRSVCRGSFGWRDDHHFGWELHSLVPQYLSNPSAYERMPQQVKYEKPEKPGLWGKLEPYREEAPDLVKLIHWGADVIVSQGISHEMLKAQLPYFLYAWPVLQPWLPEQNYRVVSEYTFRLWREAKADNKYPYDESPEHDMLALKTGIGSTKGGYPPGFSIQPNLLLHEVAKREKRADAHLYLDAAVNQAAWLVKNLDWNDPLTTKGQRMSEFITITGMAHLLQHYPEQAPPGLKQKIEEWAKVVIRRSDNLWDFRKLDDENKWTPMGDSPQKWNEPGNVVGLPAALLAAMAVLDDTKTNERLEELVYSHFDNMFGRNPVGRHFSFDAPREVEGVEFGWFRFYPGGIGRLADARFVIDGSPKDGHYPYHPEKGDFGWTEGWVQFNTPLNTSMAYLAHKEFDLKVTRQGEKIHIHLVGPLNFDEKKAESAKVTLTTPDGAARQLTLSESAPNSSEFSVQIPAQELPKGTQVRYGFGYLGHVVTIP